MTALTENHTARFEQFACRPRPLPVNAVGKPVKLLSLPVSGLVSVFQTDQVLVHNLRQYRRRLGISQTALAEQAGLNRANIGSYEEGRCQPPIPVLIRLSRVFGVTLDELVTPAKHE